MKNVRRDVNGKRHAGAVDGLSVNVRAILDLIRPGNIVMGCTGVVVGAVAAIGFGVTGKGFGLFVGCLVASLYMAGGNALNDYADREADSINHPERPIPSGRLKARTALIISATSYGVGSALILFLPPAAILIAGLAGLLLISYEIWIKAAGFAGNLVISALVGMLFLFGGAVVDRPYPALYMLILAFLATLGREVVKDIQDMSGDSERNTVPRIYGTRRARHVASVSMFMTVVLSPLPLFADTVSVFYVPLVIAADATFIYSLRYLREPERASSLMKSGMAIGLMAFIAGGVL